MLTHTVKGDMLLEKAKGDCTICEYSFDKVEYRIALTPPPRPKMSSVFWDIYMKKGYQGLVDKFFDNSFKKQIRYEIRKIVKLLRLC